MSDNDGEDPMLRRYRVDVHSMCIGFPEPPTAFKIKMEFRDNFDDDVPYARFGYHSLDSFLDDHPNLQRVLIDGKVCYKAKSTEATRDIQELVAKQRKKKSKGRGGKKGRGGGYQKKSQPFNQSFGGGRTMNKHQPPRNIPSLFGPSRQHLTRTVINNLWDVDPPYQMPWTQLMSTSIPPEESSPSTGVSRFLKALEKCGGKATLTKLNWAYEFIYGIQFSGAELKRHFGTNNMRLIHKNYLADKIELSVGYGGQWSFLSKENAERQKAWEALHKGDVIIDTPTYKWAYPTLNELYENVIKILLNTYPETIPLNNIAEFYKRAYGVYVDPVKLYCKEWGDLVKTTFKEKLQLTYDYRISLVNAIVGTKMKSLHADKPKISSMQRVTANDLGLDYNDDYDDEEEVSLPDSDETYSFSESSESDEPYYSFIKKDSTETKIDGLEAAPNSVDSVQKNAFVKTTLSSCELTKQKQKLARNSNDITALPPDFQLPNDVPKGSSVFSKMSISTPLATSSRSTKSSLPPDFQISSDAPKGASIFTRPINVTVRVNDEVAATERRIRQLELNSRMNYMDRLLEEERVKEERSKTSVCGNHDNKSTHNQSNILTPPRPASDFEEMADQPTSSMVLQKQLAEFAQMRADFAGTRLISPGQFNVRFNGRSQFISKMIKSRNPNIRDEDA